MVDQTSRVKGFRRFLYGKGFFLAVLAIGAPAIAAVIITGQKTDAEQAVEQWSEQTYGERAVSALHAVAAKAGIQTGKGLTVSSEQELRKAVEAAKDGDIIRLASGTYPQIILANINKEGEVIVTSADPKNPPVISRLIIRQSSGLILRNLELAADASSAPAATPGMSDEESADTKPMTQEEWLKNREARQAAGRAFEQAGRKAQDGSVESAAGPRPERQRRNAQGGGGGGGGFPFIIMGSERITLDRLNIHGPLDNKSAAYRITALMVRGSKQVTLSNNRFHNLRNGMGMLGLDGITIRDNEFSDIRSDGLHGGDISNAEISGNVFTGFNPIPTDHPDAIQLWATPKTVLMENISIHDNMVVRGDGSPSQGVFIRDVQNRMIFRNVQIRDNLILGGLYNAIAVCCVEGGIIEGNRVVNYPDRPQSWIRSNGSNGLTIRNNIASKFLVVGGRVEQSGNKTEQRGRIDEPALLDEWLKAKPSRRRADSALQAKLLENRGS